MIRPAAENVSGRPGWTQLWCEAHRAGHDLLTLPGAAAKLRRLNQ
jgi:hypothetical protein